MRRRWGGDGSSGPSGSRLRSFFTHWRPATAPVLDVRAVVVLHNATASEQAVLSPVRRDALVFRC
ncbi:hypothetical protein ACQPXT_01215 [Streptomyces sp. CA-100214]